MNAFENIVQQAVLASDGEIRKKNSIRESVIEKHLNWKVTAAGGATRKFNSVGRPHVPDRIVIWPGETNSARIHFVECKAPGETPREGQLREHKRLRKLGCTVLVLDTKEKVDSYVEKMR